MRAVETMLRFWPKSLKLLGLRIGYLPNPYNWVRPIFAPPLYPVLARSHSHASPIRRHATTTSSTSVTATATATAISDVLLLLLGESEQEQGMMDQCLIVHILGKQPHDLHHQPTESVFASAINPKHANQIAFESDSTT
ncbi:hypothetical protein AAZX31_12G179200 [Glycine max]